MVIRLETAGGTVPRLDQQEEALRCIFAQDVVEHDAELGLWSIKDQDITTMQEFLVFGTEENWLDRTGNILVFEQKHR